jgi:hypothetical protein
VAAVIERGEVAVGDLTADPDLTLDDDTGARLAVRLPNRWPSRKPISFARRVEAIDRRDGVTR